MLQHRPLPVIYSRTWTCRPWSPCENCCAPAACAAQPALLPDRAAAPGRPARGERIPAVVEEASWTIRWRRDVLDAVMHARRRQPRPPAYYAAIPVDDKKEVIDTDKYPGCQGLMLELCAGIVDKNKSLEEIAREEVLEECGYDVPATNFKKIVSLRSSVGVCGDRQTIFYVEVLDSQRVSPGGGNSAEGEYIEVVEMTPLEAQDYLSSGDTLSPGGCLFGLQWFLHNQPWANN